MERHTITFLPSGKTVQVIPETTLAEAAIRAGILLPVDCGGWGTCGKCRVQLVSGKVSPIDQVKDDHVKLRLIDEKELLACQWRPLNNVTVTVYPETKVKPSIQRL
ncbi:MAG: Phenol hydroxylase P5 protein [Syntrophus sp. SKADARSKE-3]|nr:Phenol hydroxylase P5 protein [Syntrophus sp. SKADARSKE-3]